jgi:hypothetical protein
MATITAVKGFTVQAPGLIHMTVKLIYQKGRAKVKDGIVSSTLYSLT